MTEFVLKRKEFYWLEGIYTRLTVKMLPFLGRTSLSPNMVTLLNIFNAFIIFWFIWTERYFGAAVLVQAYLFLDIVDGNLARYKEQCSRLGKILDQVGDRLFYNGFYIILALKISLRWEWIVSYLIIHNLYGFIATFVIVPRIRKINHFKRYGLKKFVMERGVILGMDLSTQSAITSVLLLSSFKDWIIYLITVFYFMDLIYRSIELSLNIKVNDAF